MGNLLLPGHAASLKELFAGKKWKYRTPLEAGICLQLLKLYLKFGTQQTPFPVWEAALQTLPVCWKNLVFPPELQAGTPDVGGHTKSNFIGPLKDESCLQDGNSSFTSYFLSK